MLYSTVSGIANCTVLYCTTVLYTAKNLRIMMQFTNTERDRKIQTGFTSVPTGIRTSKCKKRNREKNSSHAECSTVPYCTSNLQYKAQRIIIIGNEAYLHRADWSRQSRICRRSNRDCAFDSRVQRKRSIDSMQRTDICRQKYKSNVQIYVTSQNEFVPFQQVKWIIIM